MTYKYFFFDFDGMLCDSYTHTMKAFVKALSESRGVSINETEAYDMLKITYAKAFEHFNVTKEEIELFDKYQKDINFKPEATLYLETVKLLQSIVESGGKNFIYTNSNIHHKIDTNNLLQHHKGLKDFLLQC